MWIRITSPYFVACVAVEDGLVTETAPILKYMRAWGLEQVLDYCKTKNWKVG